MIHIRHLVKNAPLIISLIVILISCRAKSAKELIIGNWKSISETSNKRNDSLDVELNTMPSPFNIPERSAFYNFINDSVVDTKNEYFKIVRPKGRRREFQFIGTQTKYRIVRDSLMIFNLTDSIWESGLKIEKLTSDTMILIHLNGQKQIFKRHEYIVSKNPVFDQIALSSSGCFGSCPIINIIIDSTGHVIYYGEMYVDKIGFYEGQMSSDKFLMIEREFQKANVLTLKSQYSASWTDDETIFTTFCQQGKILMSVEDYGRTGPDELVWAYPSLRYLFQELELQQIDSKKIPPYLNLRFFRFEMGDQILPLTQSESFLLWNYLRSGNVVNVNFDKKIKVQFVGNYISAISYDGLDNAYDKQSEENVKGIVTDGRYYTFDLVGRHPITIDIGFNFFLVNDNLKFRERREYELN